LFRDVGSLHDPRDKAGRMAYEQFTQTIELTTTVRQAGDDQAGFRDALDGLRNNCPTRAHWETLRVRAQSALPLDVFRRFDDAVRIYPANGMVKEYNTSYLERLDNAVLIIKAKNIGPQASKVESRDAGNLHNSLPLCIGGRIMLTENIWTSVGLVNGAIGYTYDIAWHNAIEDSRQEAPFVLLIKMDKYDGPACFPGCEAIPANVVLIFQSTRDFQYGGTACSRRQFPLTLAYAITIHKSQGATLEKAVLDISQRDFQSGLTYVAISRVTSLQGLMFDVPFSLDQLQVKRDITGIFRAKGYCRRFDAGEILVPHNTS
jgi:ATP-dependent DNA helicase PIF1